MLSHTAIIQLRDAQVPNARETFEPILRLNRGVKRMRFEPAESLLTVQFDAEQTSVAEIVRLIEDSGPAVSSVAER